ncbi:putative receptor-like protein kinase [Cocos nucifera]|uniref:Putative receptor-like protein kinase n=1 Tax=Cocos nucifera TaxID=13894 RepID=A0A8K0MUN7_COCNU|nr:putative receptor-like protein kinase [Cocos nucifera]
MPEIPSMCLLHQWLHFIQITVQHHDHHLDEVLVLPIILASGALAIILMWIYRGRTFRHKSHQNSDLEGIQPSEIMLVLTSSKSRKMVGRKGLLPMIDYNLLEAASNSFSELNVSAKRVSGDLYKAHFNEGITALVKKLNGGKQENEREFENEIDLLSIICHPNIISLVGYCFHAETRFLVYEMMENGTLETQLHGPSRGSALSWHIRMKIAVDTAKGLEFLHEHCDPPIIHGDLKSSSVLLDSGFNVKISDFGLAVAVGSQNKANLQHSGALGHVAPEYLLNGELTEKSDVYAFGVILLELLMGRKPVEKTAPSQCQSIVTWAVPQLTDRLQLPNMVDPVIRNAMELKHLCQVAAIAVLCVQPEPGYRPLMADVLHSLIPIVPIELGGLWGP